MKDIASNRKAYHEYEILDTFETGIVLKGTEVKSLRVNGTSLREAYVKIINREVWLIGANIPIYKFGNINNHEECRDRKLLMHKREIERLKSTLQEKGLTLVPLKLYFKKGHIKVSVGLSKGKKQGDKRAAIRERDDKRHIQRVIKNREY